MSSVSTLPTQTALHGTLHPHTEPMSAAPANSKIAATRMACFMVRALAPTEEPNALATSLAPMP